VNSVLAMSVSLEGFLTGDHHASKDQQRT
jgi:hypothetical protein